jgi:hypothetical protein
MPSLGRNVKTQLGGNMVWRIWVGHGLEQALSWTGPNLLQQFNDNGKMGLRL